MNAKTYREEFPSSTSEMATSELLAEATRLEHKGELSANESTRYEFIQRELRRR